jgi:hypothetical protein
LKNKLQNWLEIKNCEEFNQKLLDDAIEDIKDKVLFELSFIDKMALSEQDKSKLYHAHIIYFLKKDSVKGESIAYTCDRYYRANSKNEAYGAFCKLLEEKDVTPETVSCKWNPKIDEIDPECFIDVREDA